MSEVTLGLRFTADQRELQAASDKGVENIRRIGDAGKRSNDESRKAAEQHTAALKRQADTLGMSRSQVMAYESAQHKMTDAQRQSAAASISSIDAYEKKTAMLGRVRLAAAAAGTALAVAFVAGAKASIAAAAESEQAQLRLEAVLRGTGYAAGFNGDQLDRMASKMQTKLGINDETIKKSMATLLTFRQVGRESFEDALNVAANIAAVMGTDLQSATLQLGKALEDPEQGLTALTRSGVSFNDTQKAMIKEMVQTGRAAEAITSILQIMKSQGLDKIQESMNTGITGASNALANAWDDLMESLGKAPATGGLVVTAFRGIASAMNDMRVIAEQGDGIDQFLGYFAAFRGPRAAELRAGSEATAAQDSRELGRGGVGQRTAEIADGKRVQAARDQVTTFLAAFKSDNDKLAEEIGKFRTLAQQAGLSAEDTATGEARIVAKFAKKGAKESNAGAQLVMSLTEQLQQANGEATVFDKVMRQITEGTQKFTEAEIAAALALAGEIDEMKRAKTEREANVKAAETMVRQWEREGEALAQLNESMSTQAKGLQLEIDMMGATDAQREKAIALRELENKFVKARIGLDREALAESYAMERIERERIGGLLDQRGAGQERKKALDDAKAEQKRFDDDLARGLTDSIFRGFEGGKSFARNFFDALKNMAKTTILQPVVKFLVSPITSAIGGALGSIGIPGMGGAGGPGGGGSAGLLQNAGSLFGLGNGASFASGYAATAGLGAAEAAAMIEAGTAGVAGAGMEAGAIGLNAAGMGGTALSAALPYVGLAIAAYSMLKSKKGGPASFTGLDVSGTAGAGGLSSSQFFHNSANSKRAFRWESHDHNATGGINSLVQGAFADMAKLADKLGLDKARLDSAQASFGFRVTEAGGNGGPTTNEVITAFGRNLGQLTDQLARTLMPRLDEFAKANETATQTLLRMVTVQEQLRTVEEQQKNQLASGVRSLPGQLGITALESARDALAVSPYVSPTDRLAAARTQLDETYSRGIGGDLTALSSFGSVLQQALTVGRDVGASGPAFQALFAEGNRQLNELLEKQQSIQTEILRDLPATVMEAARDQIGELKRGFGAVVAQLNAVTDELRRMREAA